MLFSQRHGYRDIRTALQFESVDTSLRNGLWDVIISTTLASCYQQKHYTAKADPNFGTLLKIWHDYFKRPIDEIPQTSQEVYDLLREYFFGVNWYEMYDFVEFLIEIPKGYTRKTFIDSINAILERDKSAYRIVAEQVTPIVDNVELVSIEEALAAGDKYRGAKEHLKAAIQFLSDRTSPDYRNSIKESISAVESVCQVITGNRKATLGDALAILEKGGELHPALKKAFSSMYGYTSDADGIRHAMIEQSTVTFEEAKYMIVACSAFINYLLASHK